MSAMTYSSNLRGDDRNLTIGMRTVSAGEEPESAASTSFVRPAPEDLSEAIPVFFIGRNARGHWVARGADGKHGGLFWRKQAAIRFAATCAWPERCATIFPAGNIELDLENQGNPLLAHIDVTRMLRSTTAAIHISLLIAVLAGAIALMSGIFLSRVKY